MALSIDLQHNSIERHHADCRYAECRDYLNVMLSVVMLNVIKLTVIMLNVVAPVAHLANHSTAVPDVDGSNPTSKSKWQREKN
jgi:hypothetical protein